MLAMKSSIEPGLLKVFRYFSSIAMAYFAIMLVYTILSAGWEWSLQLQLWLNFVVYLGLEGFLSWGKLEQRLKFFYLPIGLSISTLIPVINNAVYLIAPSQTNIDMIISRSWIWLPVMLVPLVLIAWQYNLKAVIGFTVFTNGLELIVLLAVMDTFNYETLALLGVPLVRAFAFGTVGYIVVNLVATKRRQQQKLMQAHIQLGQYATTLDQLATSRERNRLATELHDTLAHTLSGLAINLEAIKTVIDPQQIEAVKMIDNSLQVTRDGLDETRRALKALRARPLEDLGLKLALEKVIQTASERAAIPIDFIYPELVFPLPTDVEQCIYRIAQESLENIIRHANATKVIIEVRSTEDRVEFIIEDNGIGFNLAEKRGGDHFGLVGLYERSESVSGHLKVISQHGHGTQVKFTWERFND